MSIKQQRPDEPGRGRKVFSFSHVDRPDVPLLEGGAGFNLTVDGTEGRLLDLAEMESEGKHVDR
jgi:hypothetical protein